MNKDRFSDRRMAQISSLKELRNTRRKLSNRLDILEDKFEHNRWALLNIEGAMQGLVRKVESVREAWDRVVEAYHNVRNRSEKCINKATEKVNEKSKEKIQDKAQEPKKAQQEKKGQEKATKSSKSKNKSKQKESSADKTVSPMTTPSVAAVVEVAEITDKAQTTVEIAESAKRTDAIQDVVEVIEPTKIESVDTTEPTIDRAALTDNSDGADGAEESSVDIATVTSADAVTDPSAEIPAEAAPSKPRRRRGGRRRKSTSTENTVGNTTTTNYTPGENL